MRAFVSHASADLIWAQAARRALQHLDIECFLAHENVEVSEDWKERILSELRAADIFVAILSERFKSSDWCGQEVGYAVAQGTDRPTVIALSVDAQAAYGFISAVHHGVVRSEDDIGRTIEEALYVRRPRMMLAKQIARLSSCPSPAAAEDAFRPIAKHLRALDGCEVEILIKAIQSNQSVLDSDVCRARYIPEFLNYHRAAIGDSTFASLMAKTSSQGRRAVWL